MAWDNAVVTNVGVAMLQQVLSGETLTLDGAAGGTGTVAPSALMAQTALTSQKQTFSIVGASNVTNGKKINILITSTGLATGYMLQQIGIWAHVGTGSSVLFAILQDSTGIAIPSATELPDFSLNFYAVIDFDNEAEFALTVDTSSLVSISMMNAALAGKQAATETLTTEDAIADTDTFGYYDDSATASRKTAWLNIKTKLKAFFDTVYSTFSGSYTDLSNVPSSFTPATHTHGNITNDGKVGSTADRAIYTGTVGVVQAGTLPIAAGGTGQTTALAAAVALGRGYGTCATAAATVAKVATLSGFVLNTGAVVGIKFTYANTAASPTLNVNSTGAKAIYNYLTSAAISDEDIVAGMLAFFMYNGTQWVLLNPANDSGGGTTYAATLAAASWYKGTVGGDNLFWYCCDLSISGFDPSTQDVTVFPSDAATAEWFATNGYYELATSSGAIVFQAAVLPTASLNILYLLFKKGA